MIPINALLFIIILSSHQAIHRCFHYEFELCTGHISDKGSRLSGPKEIDWLLVPLGKAYTLLTDHLITGKPLWFEPGQEKWF